MGYVSKFVSVEVKYDFITQLDLPHVTKVNQRG